MSQISKGMMNSIIATTLGLTAIGGSVMAEDVQFEKIYSESQTGVYTVQPVNKDMASLTGLKELTVEEYEKFKLIPGYERQLQRNARMMMATPSLPSRVDNSEKKFFRPIFSQSGGSCGQASGIGYAFTYEMARARNVDASLVANQFPTHYTWNHLNGGSGGGSWYFDGWQMIKDNGCPTVETWGGMAGDDTRWLSGYDNYLAGMENMVDSYERIESVNTPEGLTLLKEWLNDGGIACFAAFISYSDYVDLPAGTPEAGKQMLTQWGSAGYHAMTIVGYDDSVRFDLNGDGAYTNDIDINGDNVVDMKDWEIGGLKFANSWGTYYGDEGYSYMAYRAIAEKDKRGYAALTGNCAQIVNVKAANDPKAVLKLSMEHSARNQLIISAEVKQGIVRIEKRFDAAFYRKGGAHPMQGRNNNEPIELGLDVTSLFDAINAGEPATFSIKVVEVDYSSTAEGMIHSLSLIDYSGNEVKRFNSTDDNVAINNNGLTSVTVVRDNNSVPDSDIRIQHMTNHYVDETPQLMPYLRIHNDGSEPQALSEITAEYFYTFEGDETYENSNLNWATIQPNDYSDITAKAHVNVFKNGTERRLRYWFDQDAGVIPAGGYVEIYSLVHKGDWTAYDQSNDYSFSPATVFQDAPTIVGKVNGVVVWGTAPQN